MSAAAAAAFPTAATQVVAEGTDITAAAVEGAALAPQEEEEEQAPAAARVDLGATPVHQVAAGQAAWVVVTVMPGRVERLRLEECIMAGLLVVAVPVEVMGATTVFQEEVRGREALALVEAVVSAAVQVP